MLRISREDLMAVVPSTLRRWLCLPSRIALILGMGALTGGGASGAVPKNPPTAHAAGTVIRSEGGKIYLSEAGKETELRLGASPHRDRLLRLLDAHGPKGVRLDADPRLIMSGGGGAGFSLRDLTSAFGRDSAPQRDISPVKQPSKMQKPGADPRRHSAPVDKKDG
jgi:hypothetical protein